jgi:hypothetical protein
MKSKYKNYFKSGFSMFSNFSKIISREIREKYYFEFLEKFSRQTQSTTHAAHASADFQIFGMESKNNLVRYLYFSQNDQIFNVQRQSTQNAGV